MSDDIPIIIAQEIRRATDAHAPTAVFLSSGSASQMQQYAAAGWKVTVTPGFRSDAKVNPVEVPAATVHEEQIASCTLLSCEAKYLPPNTADHIKRWRPDFLKFNCAFYDISDAAGLARSIANLGYVPLVALWRDDNSFGYRSLANFGPLAIFPNLEWDRANLIGVRDAAAANIMLSIARIYVGEERRIVDLRVANSIRDDYIARLEDALQAHQTS